MSLVHRWRRVSMHPAMRPFTEWRVHGRWVRGGRPIPAPPIVKQRIVKMALRAHGLDTVVETGTFTGEMVEALAGVARRVVSIELDDSLYRQAQARFAGRRGIELLKGDSGRLLPAILEGITSPALFWLDGHYAGAGTARTSVASPILQEIDALLAHPVGGHVVLIDDARQFDGEDGYPTVESLRARITARQPASSVSVSDDIIRWITQPVRRT